MFKISHPDHAPKLAARGIEIESVRYDFDEISFVTFFLGKKVTNVVRVRGGHEKCVLSSISD